MLHSATAGAAIFFTKYNSFAYFKPDFVSDRTKALRCSQGHSSPGPRLVTIILQCFFTKKFQIYVCLFTCLPLLLSHLQSHRGIRSLNLPQHRSPSILQQSSVFLVTPRPNRLRHPTPQSRLDIRQYRCLDSFGRLLKLRNNVFGMLDEKADRKSRKNPALAEFSSFSAFFATAYVLLHAMSILAQSHYNLNSKHMSFTYDFQTQGTSIHDIITSLG